jgi:mannosyltransferase OCH1-like enzyme
MIFQIDYKSNHKYDQYFQRNLKHNLENYQVFDDQKIEDFLVQYDYKSFIDNVKIDDTYQYASKAIICDAIRLMILYELGGIYVDADVYFKNSITNLEDHLKQQFGNRTIILSTRSFFFMAAPPKSRYIKMILDIYLNADCLKLDVFMFRKINIKKFRNELMVISEEFTKNFFTHAQITTGKK